MKSTGKTFKTSTTAWVVLFLSLAEVPSAVFAASIRGYFNDGGLAPEGTLVKLKQKGVGVVGYAQIDDSGVFQFDVAAGTYKIEMNVHMNGTFSKVRGQLEVQGNPSAGDPVSLRNVGTGAVLRTTTNARGHYSFAELESGTYKLRIDDVVVP